MHFIFFFIVLLSACAWAASSSPSLSCIVGDPAGLCLQDSGIEIPRVALVCHVFVIPTHLVKGNCQDLGFECPKELPHNSTWEKLMFGGMKAFENKTSAGACPNHTVSEPQFLIDTDALAGLQKVYPSSNCSRDGEDCRPRAACEGVKGLVTGLCPITEHGNRFVCCKQ